ncbi:MAG TPA: envelope stress response membrane protein PspC [Stellaceae bacterium]|nr:envelope stress response membrane protein PspC [Stellaceae bacterium]
MSFWDRYGRLRNPYRLYRDAGNAKIAGVCAGIADYFGIDPMAVRLGAVVGLVFFFVPTMVAYLVAAAFLPAKPPALYASPEEEAFWRGVATAPDRTVQALHAKFAALGERLARMETAVTSQDFELHRKFRDLGR